MPTDHRIIALCVWNAVIVFVSALYLTGGFVKATTVGIFVLVCCLLGFGQRWLFRAGFAVSVLALAIYLGVLPSPEEWLADLKGVHELAFSLER